MDEDEHGFGLSRFEQPPPPPQLAARRPLLAPVLEPDALSPSAAAGGAAVLGRDFVKVLQPGEMIHTLVGVHGNVDVYDENGWTCLHWAALLGQVEHVAALLDSEADPAMPTAKALALPWCVRP